MPGFFPKVFRNATLLFLVFCQSTFSSPTNSFHWKSAWDIPLITGSILGGIYAHYSFQNVEPRFSDTLSGYQLNPLDHWAKGSYSRSMAAASDILALGAFTPLLFSGWEARQQANAQIFWMDALMFSQALALSSSLNLWTRSLIFRPRPFLFSNKASTEDKRKPEAYHSYYSGHASAAFLTAVYTSWTFQTRRPQSQWIPLVWGFSLSTASVVATLRVFSGKHYPSDVLTGAVVGSAFGFFIPWLHQSSVFSQVGLQMGPQSIQVNLKIPKKWLI